MNDKTQTIELTSKELKTHILIGYILMILGFVVVSSEPNLGVLGILGGLSWVIITKVRIWWNHE
jgi:hypothetical protein